MRKKGAAPVVPASGQLGALGVEIITQYAGQEQVDLAVLVDVPGSWFGAGADGGLAAAEKKEKYLIDAYRRVWAACTFFALQTINRRSHQHKCDRSTGMLFRVTKPFSQSYRTAICILTSYAFRQNKYRSQMATNEADHCMHNPASITAKYCQPFSGQVIEPSYKLVTG